MGVDKSHPRSLDDGASLSKAGYSEGSAFPLASVSTFDNTITTTSTSYVAAGGSPDRVRFDTTNYPFSELQVSIASRIVSDTAGQTAFLQVRDVINGVDYTATEVTVTGTSSSAVVSDRDTLVDTGVLEFGLRQKSSDGAAQASAQGAQVNLWGVL